MTEYQASKRTHIKVQEIQKHLFMKKLRQLPQQTDSQHL